MGSQFVDLNADGFLDYLAATFDGSPHVSYGGAKGFGAPEQLLDAHGERILISSIWNYETEAHENLGRSMPDGQAQSERCISALAFDGDDDGDYDLLLGSYENGHLYLQRNEGTNAEPKSTGRNIPVLAGDKPWAIAEKMTAPRLVDWDGDGDLDLIAGSFGDSWGPGGSGGGVYLSLNVGARGKPAFGPLVPLLAPGPNGGAEAARPQAGLYVDAVDYDGDGDLDLVVGGYSLWTPPARVLTADEQATAARLQELRKAIQEKQAALSQLVQSEADAAAEGLDRNSKEWREKWSEVYKKHTEEFKAIGAELVPVTKQLGDLIPAAQREAFVWWYERL